MEHQDYREPRSDGLPLGLAWFSIALGVAELAAPRSLARLIGVPEDDRNVTILRGLGAREVANGIAILAQPGSAAWLWSRVGGDAMDLAYLGAAMSSDEAEQGRIAASAAAVLGVTMLDVLCARQLGREEGAAAGRGRDRQDVRVQHAVTLNRPIEEVYQFWRNFDNFPRFMRHLESVQTMGEGRSRWRATGPAGTTFEWEAEITEEVENERIAWRSLAGSDVETSGSVRFERAPGARGTEVRVDLQYRPPAGRVGRTIAWLFGEEPEQQVRDDLRRFKQVVETGEVVLSEGPGLWRPAQPPASAEQIRNLAGVQR
jgi:uncharacterized membrane protein